MLGKSLSAITSCSAAICHALLSPLAPPQRWILPLGLNAFPRCFEYFSPSRERPKILVNAFTDCTLHPHCSLCVCACVCVHVFVYVHVHRCVYIIYMMHACGVCVCVCHSSFIGIFPPLSLWQGDSVPYFMTNLSDVGKLVCLLKVAIMISCTSCMACLATQHILNSMSGLTLL